MTNAPTVIDQEECTDYDWDEMQRDLDRAKSAVFMGKNAAFFGPLMCTLDFTWAHGPDLPTAATDGKTFWWNPKDFLRCDIEERKSTIMHELWHVARLHALRQGERCPKIWNVACDIKINRDLQDMNYFIGADWVLRPDLDHVELEEEIYDLLNKPGGGGGANGNMPGNNPGSHGAGQCSHSKMPVTPQSQQAMLAAAVKAMQAAQMAGQPGSIPGNTQQIIEKFLAPKIPWEAALNQFFLDLLDNDYSWARPNRRYPEMYLPSQYEDEGRLEHLIYYQDVSGSVSDKMILRFNSELKHVWDTFQPKKMTVVQFDTIIQQEDVFNEGDDFSKIKITGRGGTCLVPVREHMDREKPTACVIFTDMCVGFEPMLPAPTWPIIWVAVNASGAKPPHGKVIRINE
jgi:predicted metal-dependent peptidase